MGLVEAFPVGVDGRYLMLKADAIDGCNKLAEHFADAIVTDSPYGLSFMGRNWDHGVPGVPFWQAAMRVLKPGGYLLAFGGTRTFHRLACAIEDAGFEIRDCIMWVYGSGFPKSLDVGKAIDAAAGATREVVGPNPNARPNHDGERIWIGDKAGKEQSHPPLTAPATELAKQWDGWGTSLKPSWEPIIVARKPLDGTVAANVAKYGTGAINVDACRVPAPDGVPVFIKPNAKSKNAYADGLNGSKQTGETSYIGRFPANLIHDGSDDVEAEFAKAGERKSGSGNKNVRNRDDRNAYGKGLGKGNGDGMGGDTGSASRFFYCAKASKADRGEGNKHPTVKPTPLMRYLVKLVCRPGGRVLDPFAGSGSTGKACALEGMDFVGIDNDAEPGTVATAVRRIDEALTERKATA